jgi:hypothetical protein
VRALLARRDARLDLAGQALATMAVVIVIAAASLAGEPRAGKAQKAASCRPRVTGNRGCR